MKHTITLIIGLMVGQLALAQTTYFPTANTWDTIATETLEWCPDSLDALQTFLDDKNTKAFIVLKNGKIAVEWYFGSFTSDSLWYWASAGKALTATLVGIAQQEGYLNLNDKTSDYLGAGWTNCSTLDEELITVRHQLTMTTGLDYTVASVDCTDDTCLYCLNTPGTQWYYHNAPYTLLDGVIEQATGRTMNAYFNQKIGSKIGALGAFYPVDYNNVFFSRARDMARFGLLILNKGNWNGTTVLSDTAYYNQMVNTSQSINQAYGYLWWLNGKSTYRLPGTTYTFTGSLIPNAPADMFAALGKNDQKIYVVPSDSLVVIRLGEEADTVSLALSTFDNDLWRRLSQLGGCPATQVAEIPELKMGLYPNPATDKVVMNWQPRGSVNYHMQLYTPAGEVVFGMPLFKSSRLVIPLDGLSAGIYLMRVTGSDGAVSARRLVVQ